MTFESGVLLSVVAGIHGLALWLLLLPNRPRGEGTRNSGSRMRGEDQLAQKLATWRRTATGQILPQAVTACRAASGQAPVRTGSPGVHGVARGLNAQT